jgi:hypothetical protein
MAVHPIRLRGGWEAFAVAGGSAQRVTLPLAAFPEGSDRLRLVRPFQSPPLDPARESLWLRLDNVPGLVAVTLNGRPLGRPPFDPPLNLPLGQGLPARNRLVLEVESGQADPGSPWGDVALLIVRDDDPAAARGFRGWTGEGFPS